jgi:GNAT superfamily N-acetyltransferase
MGDMGPRIALLGELADAGSAESAVERIFFASSETNVFGSEWARAAFRERWLGRYLEHDRAHFLVALGAGDAVIGYLAGCLDDPARTARFADIDYFATIAPLTAVYPAHLHINVAAEARSTGVGARLIATFAEHAAKRGAPGMHVITGLGMRNVRFYLRQGFTEVGTAEWVGRPLVVLGRRLVR